MAKYQNGLEPPKNRKLWDLVNRLQGEMGGGYAKCIKLTLFVDAKGNIVGRSQIDAQKFYPATIWDDLTNC